MRERPHSKKSPVKKNGMPCTFRPVHARRNDATLHASDLGPVLSSIDTSYLRIDRNYVIREANEAALKWLGVPDSEVIDRPFSHVSPNSPMRMLRSAVEGTILIDRELKSYRRPERMVELHLRSVDEGAIMYFRDVTEVRQLEQDAARTARLLQESLDTLAAHVVILDRSGTVIASNRSWQRFAQLRGLAMQAGEPLNYLALHEAPLARHPEAQRVAAALRSVLTGQRSNARLIYAWHIDGRLRWFQLSAATFEIAGAPHVAVTNEEVTAVKEAEEALGQIAGRLLAVQEEERQSIAAELHDSTVQHLAAIGLNVMSVKQQLGDQQAPLALLKEIESSLDEACRELRTLTYLMHPPRLERDGLGATLRDYVDGFARRTGLRAILRTSPSADALPFGLQRTVLRIVQEGLANAHRHARATRVHVDVRCLRHQLHLIVRDNGTGVRELRGNGDAGGPAPRFGVGIPSIRARLRQFGGELQIGSGPGGTRLHAVVPLALDTVPLALAGGRMAGADQAWSTAARTQR